jgi:sugar porter (SP) family MFS transporter
MGMQGRALRLAQLFLIVAPSFMSFGYNQAGVGGLLNLPSWVKQFPAIDTINTKGAQHSHNSTVQGAVVASFTIGALIGSLSCMTIGDYLGRRRTIFLGSITSVIGQIGETTANSLLFLVIGRVSVGAGIGILSATVPVWQSECSSAKSRGQYVVLVGLFIAAGFAVTQWVNFGFYHIEYSPLSWRIPLVIPLLFELLIMGTVFFFPESPRWLVLKNRSDAARHALAAYKGLDLDSDEIIAEVSGIEFSFEESKQHAASVKDIFTMGEDRLFYRFMLCIVIQFLQQMCGGSLISFYIPILFQDNLGLNQDLSKILAACNMTFKFFSCFVSFFLIDRLGRRVCFIVSGTGMSLCMIALAVSNSFGTAHSASIASAFFLFLFNFFYPFGFLGANYLYTTEVAPIRLRVAMQAISTANHWLWMFVVAMITPIAVDSIGYRYYLVYALISGSIPPLVYFFYPETMNRNLEQLNLIFREAPSIMSIVSMARKVPKGETVVPGPEKQEALVEQVEIECKN